MKGGWFVGGFQPTAFLTSDAEVGFKTYAAGEINPMHYHLRTAEVTLVVQGKCRMGEMILNAGDIILVEPMESSDFEAITDCTVVVYKSASVPGDKYDGIYQSE